MSINYRVEGSTVIIEEGVTEIPAKAFFGRKDITCVDFPTSCKRIGRKAFGNCSNLHLVRFSYKSGRINIHPQAFFNTDLCVINLPAACAGQEPLERGWFKDKMTLKIDKDYNEIHTYVEKYERKASEEFLKEARLYMDDERGGYIITEYRGDKLEWVIPGRTWYYGDAFPIVGIAEEAFVNSPVRKLVLPYPCRYIGKDAFKDCTFLEEVKVYFDPKEMNVHPTAFQNCKIRGAEDFTQCEEIELEPEYRVGGKLHDYYYWC